MTLTERLRESLREVISVSDRDTDIYIRARKVLAEADAANPNGPPEVLFPTKAEVACDPRIPHNVLVVRGKDEHVQVISISGDNIP